MSTTTSVRGRFLWYEIMSGDPAAAKAFYPRVTGWGTQDMEIMDQAYTVWMNGERPGGGVMQRPPEAKAAGATPHWLCYVGTDDVDATLKAVEKAGGQKMMGPMDIPTVGRIGVCADPQGAVFAVFTPEDEMPEAEPAPRLFSWHELATTDYQAAFAFYSALFGWEEIEALDMGPAGTYYMYGRNGVPLGGMYNKSEDQPGPAWLPYVQVEDVAVAAKRAEKEGGKVIVGPMEVPGGDLIIQGMDREGAMFALHQAAPKS